MVVGAAALTVREKILGVVGAGEQNLSKRASPPPPPITFSADFRVKFLSIAVSFQLQILIVVYIFLLTQTALDIKKVHSCP